MKQDLDLVILGIWERHSGRFAKEIRLLLDLTVPVVARRLGVSTEVVRQWENRPGVMHHTIERYKNYLKDAAGDDWPEAQRLAAHILRFKGTR